MIVSFLVVFVALAASQALVTVKLADFLSPTVDAGRTSSRSAREDREISLA